MRVCTRVCPLAHAAVGTRVSTLCARVSGRVPCRGPRFGGALPCPPPVLLLGQTPALRGETLPGGGSCLLSPKRTRCFLFFFSKSHTKSSSPEPANAGNCPQAGPGPRGPQAAAERGPEAWGMRSLLWLPAAAGAGPSGDRLPPAASPPQPGETLGPSPRFPAAPGGPRGSVGPSLPPSVEVRAVLPTPFMPGGARLREGPASLPRAPSLTGGAESQAEVISAPDLPPLSVQNPQVLFSPPPPAWGPPQPSPLLGEASEMPACCPRTSGCPGGPLAPPGLSVPLSPAPGHGPWEPPAEVFPQPRPSPQLCSEFSGHARLWVLVPSLSQHPGFMPATRPSPWALRRVSCPGGADPQFPGAGRQ